MASRGKICLEMVLKKIKSKNLDQVTNEINKNHTHGAIKKHEICAKKEFKKCSYVEDGSVFPEREYETSAFLFDEINNLSYEQHQNLIKMYKSGRLFNIFNFCQQFKIGLIFR